MSIYNANKITVVRNMRSLLVCLLIVCFITTNVQAIVLYNTQPPMYAGEAPLNIDVDTFSLSPELGTIKYVHKGTSDKVVFHIQDAHCNYAGQNSIYQIINVLNKEYKVSELNLEGGVGEYDLSVFTDMPDREIRKKVADYFVKWGEVSGPEMFALMNPDKVKLWGIENIGLYLKNLSVYRDSLSYTDRSKSLMNNVRHYLNNLKVHMFNENLLTMDTKFAAYKTNNITFKDYIEYLVQQSKLNGVPLKQYPNIFLLSHVMDEEKLIDFKKANLQREELIKYLEDRISANDMNKLAVNLAQLKNKIINEYDFYEYLLETAKKYGIDIKDYPKLHQFIIYISMYNKVDKFKIMDEKDDIEKVLKEDYYENDDQRRLDILSRNLILLETLFDFSFTVRDYEYYRKNTNNFDVENYLTFIEKFAPVYKIEPVFEGDILELDTYRNRISKFYEYSFKRDIAFLDNMKLSGNEVKSGIMVTGGFHTENLLSLLEEEDISYVSIMPNFKNKKGYKSPYFELLAGKEVPAFEHQIETIFFSIQVPSILNIINIFSNTDARQRAEALRIGALAIQTMLTENKAQVIKTIDNNFIVFAMENNAPVVKELSQTEFNQQIKGKIEYNTIADGVDLSQPLAIWALSRVAEENINSLRSSEKITPEKVEEQIRSLIERLDPNVQEILNASLEAVKEQNRGILIKENLKDLKGKPMALSSNEAIYLPDNSIDDAAYLLFHELVGGTYNSSVFEGEQLQGGHSVAEKAENFIRNGEMEKVNTILSEQYARRYPGDKSLWTMTQEEVQTVKEMDFAAWGIGAVASLKKVLGKDIGEEEDKSLRAKLKDYIGKGQINNILSLLTQKTSKSKGKDSLASWMESLGSFLDNMKKIEGNPRADEFIRKIISISDSSRSIVGFGEIFKPIIDEEVNTLRNRQIEAGEKEISDILGSIENLFIEDINSGLKDYIDKIWKELVQSIKSLNGADKEYLHLGSFDQTYRKNHNIELLNGIARNSDIRNNFLENVKEKRLEYLIGASNAYSNNIDQIFYKYNMQSNPSYFQRITAIANFLEAYLESSDGNDIIGVIVGNDLVMSPLSTQETKQVNIMGKIQPKKKLKVSRQIGIDTVVVSLEEVKDIFGENILVSPVKNAPGKEALVPDSFLIRGYDGKYKIVLVERDNTEDLRRTASVAVNKMKILKNTINSLDKMDSSTSFGDIIGRKMLEIQAFAKENKSLKTEAIRMFAELSSKYFNREAYFNKGRAVGTLISSREKQMFNYMMFYAVMDEMLKPNNIYINMDTSELENKKQPITLAVLFKELINKKTELFKGNNAIPLPFDWDRSRGKYDPVFNLKTALIGDEGSSLRKRGPSAIGNIKLADGTSEGTTVIDFDKELNVQVNLNEGTINISAKKGDLLNGDISLKVNPKPIKQNVLVDSLNNLVLNDKLTKNTLTKKEREEVEKLINLLKDVDVYTFSGSNQDNLYGFTDGGKIFLDEKMLLDPLALFHEMGESKVDVPKGYGKLNRHTFLRGVGKKTRKALAAIIAEGDEAKLEKMKNINSFIEEIKAKRKEMKLGVLPEPEEGLIEYNFAMKAERGELGLKSYLFGLQDHMDPYLNAEFTGSIKGITNSLNRGVHDIIVIRETDVFASAKLAQLKRMARKGMFALGHSLTFIVQQEGERIEETLDKAYSRAKEISEEHPQQLPKIFLNLAYGEGDKATLEKESEAIRKYVNSPQNSAMKNMTVIVDELIQNLESGEAPKLDVGKLIVVASGLLDDKRRVVNFKMSADDLKQTRQDMIKAFMGSGILTLPETETVKYDVTTSEGLDNIIKAIESGRILMRITQINWEEITDWFEANSEIMRSL